MGKALWHQPAGTAFVDVMFEVGRGSPFNRTESNTLFQA